jgi:hypothetical protein
MAMKPIIRYIGVILGTLRAEYRQLANRYFGKIERFDGEAREICQQILDRLWEGDFYRTSLGHFDFFWMRDFGTVCESLVKLGHADKVHHTLRWAMRYYRRANIVSTCIDKAGNCFEAPGPAIDTLPWLLHCLVVSKYPLSKSEHVFLEKQLRKYRKRYLREHGHLKRMKVGEMRDAVIYDRSAYAVSLVARLATCVKKLRLGEFPFPPEFYRDELLNHYWNGEYFQADHSTKVFSAESALMPFFLDIVSDSHMVNQTMDHIAKQKLNKPYPMIYTNKPEAFRYHPWMTAPYMPNYAGETVWSWFGEFYLHLLKRHKRPEYKEQYESFSAMIERHGNFPEMLNKDGSWYYAPIYRSDPGMVWVALFLELPTPAKST